LSRRTTLDLYAQILEVLRSKGGKERITKLSYGVGMPVDRLKNFLEKLAQAGLVNLTERGDVFYVLTVRGVDFLEAYWKMKSFLSTLEE